MLMSGKYFKAICVGVIGIAIIGTILALKKKKKQVPIHNVKMKSTVAHNVKMDSKAAHDKFKQEWLATESKYMVTSGAGRKLYFEQEGERLKNLGLSGHDALLEIQTKWRNLSPSDKFEWNKQAFTKPKGLLK
jgi:hypothetical protein